MGESEAVNEREGRSRAVKGDCGFMDLVIKGGGEKGGRQNLPLCIIYQPE